MSSNERYACGGNGVTQKCMIVKRLNVRDHKQKSIWRLVPCDAKAHLSEKLCDGAMLLNQPQPSSPALSATQSNFDLHHKAATMIMHLLVFMSMLCHNFMHDIA